MISSVLGWLFFFFLTLSLVFRFVKGSFNRAIIIVLLIFSVVLIRYILFSFYNGIAIDE
jgi:hypothetical protein